MKSYLLLLLLALTLVITGCGGGSSGTGVEETTIGGVVRNLNGEVIQGVLLTVLETGDSDISDERGEFLITTILNNSTLTLEVESGSLTSEVELNDLETEDSTAIELDIKVDPELGEIEVNDLEVRAKIVGTCDPLFENNRTIKQGVALPNPAFECTAKVWIEGDGKGLGGLPFIVEYRACPSNSPWTRIAVGETRSDLLSLGIGQSNFTIQDDEEHCVYRIVAPFGVPNLKEVKFNIQTFTKQKFDTED